MIKHPEQMGFTLGLKIRIGQRAIVKNVSDDARKRDVVYVALFSGQRKPVRKGDVLRVGQTKGRLLDRWKGIAGTFSRVNLRHNEIGDRSKWLEVANGK